MIRLCSFIVLLWSALPAAGQTFNKRYSFPDYSSGVGFSVEEAENHYSIYSTIGDTLYKYAIHTIDFDGELIDSARYYEDSTAQFIGYSNTTDAFDIGIVSAGTINYGDVRHGVIVKWSTNEDTLATKKFIANGNYTRILFQQAKAISDGFVAIGSISDGVSIEKIILIKTDLELNELWRMEYGNTSVPHAGYSVVQTPDGGFLLGGVRKIGETWDHCVVKTDSEGMQQYLKYYGNEFYAYYAHVTNSLDGNYYFGGLHQIGENDDFSQICKLNTELDTIWCKVYGNHGPECRVNSLKLLEDGNVIVCGMDRSNFIQFGYILKIDPDGNELWYRKYAQTEDNWAYFHDVIQTTDGGYLLTGALFPEVDMTQDIWGLKLDEDGCLVPGCDTLDHVFSTRAGFGFSVYPNPAKQFVNVYVGLTPALSKGEGVSFELTDMQGRIVKSFSPQLTDATYMLDVEELPAGVYMLSLVVDGVIGHTEKIMKE